MNSEARTHAIHRSLNKPLTILGAERKLFFLSAVTAAAVFNLFGSLLGAIGMFVSLYLLARWATATDPQILRILINASKFKVRYDPGKQGISLRKGITPDA